MDTWSQAGPWWLRDEVLRFLDDRIGKLWPGAELSKGDRNDVFGIRIRDAGGSHFFLWIGDRARRNASMAEALALFEDGSWIDSIRQAGCLILTLIEHENRVVLDRCPPDLG